VSVDAGRVVSSDWDTRLVSGANAFDLVRLVLATLVVLEHSYFLIENSYVRDPLYRLSGGQLNFGAFAVYLFFSVSGFLVTRSVIQSAGTVAFLGRRIARIVPGFLMASVVGFLIVGPLTSNDISQYVQSQKWGRIVIDTLLLRQYGLADVLQGNAVGLVHGTLWSIRYEFDCYLLLAVVAAVGLLQRRRVVTTYVVIAAALALGLVFPTHVPRLDTGVLAMLFSSPHRWPELFSLFFVGSAFYVFRHAVPKTNLVFGIMISALLASFAFGGAFYALMIAGTYVALFIALSCAAEVHVFGQRVDLSYGIYLYGWPAQQLILYATGSKLSPEVLFLVSVLPIAAVALASWLLVERPALRLARTVERSWLGGARRTSAI
jgi:peptidoglycan/LPS O-acetylase OafA/YrhL